MSCECSIIKETHFLVDLRLLVKEGIADIGIPLDTFGFLPFQWLSAFVFFWFLGSLQTSLLCIIGELAWVWGCCCWRYTGDRWQVTQDTCHLQMTGDKWNFFLLSSFLLFLGFPPFSLFLYVLVSVLLFTHHTQTICTKSKYLCVERFSVSHMQDFFNRSRQVLNIENWIISFALFLIF